MADQGGRRILAEEDRLRREWHAALGGVIVGKVQSYNRMICAGWAR